MTAKNKLFRLALGLLSGFGAYAGGSLSLRHAQTGEICPMLGPIPACYLVFLGYLLVFVSAVITERPIARKLFYLGWTPVFLLALTGVTLELTKGHVCPPGALGIPQCFYSFTMALLCLGFFKLSLKSLPT